jgi:AcrR family transcriptional regulator
MGVQPTAIHWHFARRQDLVDALLDVAVRRFNERLPAMEGGVWQEVLRTHWEAYRSVLRSDAGLCQLIVGEWVAMARAQAALDASYLRIDAQIRVLLEAGFTAEDAARAFHLLSTYTRGCLQNELSYLGHGGPADHLDLSVRDLHTSLDVPSLRAVAAHWTYTFATDADFAEGLRAIIRGLEATLSASRRGRPRQRRRP